MARGSSLTHRRAELDASTSPGVIVPLDLLEAYGATAAATRRVPSIVTLLLRNKLGIIAAALLGLFAVGLLSFLQQPIYRSHLSLEILALNDRFLAGHEVTPTTSGVGAGALEADIAGAVSILNSRTLIERAMRTAPSTDTTLPVTVDEIRDSLNIDAVRTTRLIAATFESPDAVTSSRFLNALGDEFVDYTIGLTTQSRGQTRGRLGTELETMKQRLRASELELRDYSRAAALVFADNQTSVEQ